MKFIFSLEKENAIGFRSRYGCTLNARIASEWEEDGGIVDEYNIELIDTKEVFASEQALFKNLKNSILQ